MPTIFSFDSTDVLSGGSRVPATSFTVVPDGAFAGDATTTARAIAGGQLAGYHHTAAASDTTTLAPEVTTTGKAGMRFEGAMAGPASALTISIRFSVWEPPQAFE